MLAIDPELMSAYSGSADSPFEGDFSYVPVDRPPLVSLPSLEQIATEVLDMNGGEHSIVNGAMQTRISEGAGITTQQVQALTDATSSIEKADSSEQQAGNKSSSAPTDKADDSSSTQQRRDSFANLPLYKPPASRSPELKRCVAQETNGSAHDGLTS